MALLLPIDLSPGDKLQILRRLDQFRTWQSLEEKRYCLGCGRLISGREILVVGGTRGTGPLRLVCPTRGCHAIPMDWVQPTDEVLHNMSTLLEKGAAPHSAKVTASTFGARLRRLAARFRAAARRSRKSHTAVGI